MHSATPLSPTVRPTPNFMDRVHSRAFGFVAGRSLLYNTCWEDPAVDRQALQLSEKDRVLVIASAGCNALDYALCGPQEVVAVDANPRQIALLELKLSAIRNLGYDQAFALFGQGGSSAAGDWYHDFLRRDLSPFAKRYWDRRWTWFDGRSSFYWRGLSGLAARLIRTWFERDPELSQAVDRMMTFTDLPAQRAWYDAEVAPRLWTPALEKKIGRRVFLTLLGVPAAQRREIAHSHPGGVAGFIRHAVDGVFRDHCLHTNYFWRVYLAGQYSRTCCPSWLTREGFAALKGGLVHRVTPKVATVSELLVGDQGSFSRFVLLDHMDWMGWYHPEALTEEWQLILQRATPAARILFRSASPVPDWLDQVRVKGSALAQLLTFHGEQSAALHRQDRVGTYASFHIADLAATAIASPAAA